jgi:signal transduction histidine kinase
MGAHRGERNARLTISAGPASLYSRETVAVAKERGDGVDLRALGHDLRTPLAVIHGYAELLRSEELSPEQRARACDLLLEKCEELNIVIRRLLEPSESGLQTPVAIEQTA